MPSKAERLQDAKEHYKRLGRTKEMHEDDYSDGDWWSDEVEDWEEPVGDEEADGSESGMVAQSSFHLIDALEVASARRHEQMAKKRAAGEQKETRAKDTAEVDEASVELLEVLRERGVKLGSLGKLTLLELRRIEAATRQPIVVEEDAAAADDEAMTVCVTNDFAAVAPDDKSGGLPSLAIALPLDCWGEIAKYLSLIPLLRLSNASQTLRGLVEDSGVWRRVWKTYSVNITSKLQVVFLRGSFLVNGRAGVDLVELPYQYRWSGLWSLRYAVVDQTLCMYTRTANRYQTVVYQREKNETATGKRERRKGEIVGLLDDKRLLDAEAWRELYETTHSELVAEWARVMANKAAGNPNLALAILDGLDLDAFPAAVKKTLRVPSTAEDRNRLQSELVLDSLSHREEDEEDVTATDIVTLTPMSIVNDVEEHDPNPRRDTGPVWMRDSRPKGEGGRRRYIMAVHRWGPLDKPAALKKQIANVGRVTERNNQWNKNKFINSKNFFMARISRFSETNLDTEKARAEYGETAEGYDYDRGWWKAPENTITPQTSTASEKEPRRAKQIRQQNKID